MLVTGKKDGKMGNGSSEEEDVGEVVKKGEVEDDVGECRG